MGPPCGVQNSLGSSLAHLTRYTYDVAGRQQSVISGVRKNGSNTVTTTTKTFYDDLGRQTFVAANWVNFAPPDTDIGGAIDDDDRVTSWEYNGLGQVTALTAYNGSSEKQITLYKYTNSFNASLVTAVYYPDAVNSSVTPPTIPDTDDGVQITYNLDGSLETRTDQRGVVMTYTYDTARRLSIEGATTVPSGVDDHVKSIKRTYDNLGRLLTITSYAFPSGTGTVRNQIEFSWISTGQINQEYQSHENLVDGLTPYVDYNYATTSSGEIYTNGLRPTEEIYPSGEKAIWNYGSADSIDDRLHRVSSVYYDHSGPVTGFAYSYNGRSRIVKAASTSIASLKREMFGAMATVYEAWDRFGRTLHHNWNGLDNVDYTHDYAGNRLTREITVTGINVRDQKYTYDGLHRLKDVEEGLLNTGAITNKSFAQQWTLDQLGNWPTFKQDNDGNGTWDLDQSRSHNEVNELTEFTTTSWVDPQHDDAGNMILMPRPKAPTSSYAAKYDAWNRLVEMKAGTTVVQTNEYDGLHRRIIRDETGGSGNKRHFYYNQRWQVLEERVEVSGTIDPDPLARNIWHPYYIDALALRTYDDNLDGNYSVQYYTHDANFNVTAVYSVVSAVFNARERYAYTPYGEVTYLNPNFTKKTTQVTGVGN